MKAVLFLAAFVGVLAIVSCGGAGDRDGEGHTGADRDVGGEGHASGDRDGGGQANSRDPNRGRGTNSRRRLRLFPNRYADNDRDGILNGVDRRPNNYNSNTRRNRMSDRDGDGIGDRRDPNPRRYNN